MSSTRLQHRDAALRRLTHALAAASVVLALGSSCGTDAAPIVGATTTSLSASDASRLTPAPTSTSSSTELKNPTTSLITTTTSVPPPTASSSTATGAEDRAIIDAYIAYWDARHAANSGVPNPADPALPMHATGAQLEAVIAETQANLDKGEAFETRSNPANVRRVSVISVSGDEALVQECFVDDGIVVRRDTGAVVDDSIETQNVRGELRRVDGTWRVSKALLLQTWEGVAGCALAS